MSKPEPFCIGGAEIRPGESKIVNITVARLYDYTEMKIPVKVIHGREAGPALFVSSAIHGDEINGVEIVKRLLRRLSKKKILGTLVAVPIVNVFGFNGRSRYLPDRRDLNRSFPGSEHGSLASRLAHIFVTEIVEPCTHGIDLHTGAIHRSNLPQIRACLDDAETKRLARAFRAPVILDASLRDGSLRQAALERGMPVLVYEGGEALRFNERAIRAGLRGILSVMKRIGMLQPADAANIPDTDRNTYIALSSQWVRAPQSGTLRILKPLGAAVEERELLGVISDPFGEGRVKVRAEVPGVIIGATRLPLVNRGDALFHIATFKDLPRVEESLAALEEPYDPEFR